MTASGKVCSEYLFHWFEIKVKAAAGMVFRVGQAVSQHGWHLCAAMVASPSAETSDQPNMVQLFVGSVSCINVDRLLDQGLYGQIMQLDQFSVACIVMGISGHMGEMSVPCFRLSCVFTSITVNRIHQQLKETLSAQYG